MTSILKWWLNILSMKLPELIQLFTRLESNVWITSLKKIEKFANQVFASYDWNVNGIFENLFELFFYFYNLCWQILPETVILEGKMLKLITPVEYLSHFRSPFYPLDTRRKQNVCKTFRRRPERLIYVQFTSCVQG